MIRGLFSVKKMGKMITAPLASQLNGVRAKMGGTRHVNVSE